MVVGHMSDLDDLARGQLWMLKQAPTERLPSGPTYDILVLVLEDPGPIEDPILDGYSRQRRVLCRYVWSTDPDAFDHMRERDDTWMILDVPSWVRIA